jgi:hypothetical protein
MPEYNPNPLTTEQDGDIVVPDDAIDGKWQDNGFFDHVMGQPVVDQQQVDSYTDDNDVLVDVPSKRRDRQKALYVKHGFYAPTKEALVRATGLSRPDIEESIGGGAKYIAIIVQHQSQLDSKPDDPNAAGRAVTKEFTEFAKRARGDRAALDYLIGIIGNDTDVLPSSSIANIREINDWKYEGLLTRAILDLKRLTELVEFAEGKGKDPFEDKLNMSDHETVKIIQKFVNSLSVRETVDLIKASYQQHQNELAFWLKTIQEVEKFSSGRIKAMAKSALGDLGVIRPE